MSKRKTADRIKTDRKKTQYHQRQAEEAKRIKMMMSKRSTTRLAQ